MASRQVFDRSGCQYTLQHGWAARFLWRLKVTVLKCGNLIAQFFSLSIDHRCFSLCLRWAGRGQLGGECGSSFLKFYSINSEEVSARRNVNKFTLTAVLPILFLQQSLLDITSILPLFNTLHVSWLFPLGTETDIYFY